MKEIKAMNTVIAATIVVVGLIVVANIVAGSFKDISEQKLALEEKQVMNQAIYECGQVASATWRDVVTGATITEPYKKSYAECLRDKGYEITISIDDEDEELKKAL